MAQEQPLETAAPPAAAEDTREVVITGSRITRPSGFTTPTPVTVLGAQDMARLGLTNVGDALNQLPSFRGTVSPNTSGVFFGAIGSRQADLRGLGPQRTLVLVDGRRFVGTTSQGTVDLNLIPSSLLQQTEVVTGGASAAYGSDAVAGVVNLILDKEFSGFRSSVQYGEAEVGDNETYQVSLAGGMDFAGGRGHIIAGGEYEDGQGAGNVYYSRGWGRQEWNVIPNPLFCAPSPTPRTPGPCAAVPQRVSVSLNGLPANVLISDVHTATQTPGGVIKTPGPLFNTAFNADGTPRPFQQGDLAGPIFMSGGEGHGQTAFFLGQRLVVPVERYSLFSHADFDLTNTVKAFAEVTFGHVDGRNIGSQMRELAIPGASNGVRITQDNPFLPPGMAATIAATGVVGADGRRAVFMGRQGDDLGFSRGRATSTVDRYVVGFNGNLGGAWKWDAYVQYGSDRFEQTVENNRDNAAFLRAVDAVAGPGGTPVCRVNADANPANDDAACRPLNLFGTNNWSQEAKDYVFQTSRQDTRFTQQVAAANLQGNLFEGWAGPVSLALGAEYREDEAVGSADPVSQTQGWYVGNAAAVNGVIRVKEAYLETVVPLLRDKPLARRLELNGAIRETDYNLSGRVNTWKLGGTYGPIDSVRFRATRSRDIRAPNLEELFVTSASFVTVRDPFRANQQAFPFVRLTSAANLTPEEADTFTAGVVLQPTWRWLDRLRFSVDYYDIEINKAISRPTGQIVLDRCFAGATEFCGLITRATPGDPGSALISIDTPNLNIQSFEMNGIDFEADYNLPLPRGNLSFRLLASYVNKLVTTDTAGSVDRAGMTGFPIGLSSAGNKVPALPEWTYNLTSTWAAGPVSLTANARYIDSGTFDVTLIGPDDPRYDVNLPNSISDNTVDGRFYLDLAGQFSFYERESMQAQVFVAVDNVFDKDPPVSPGSGPTNMYLFDRIGRQYQAGLRFRF